MKRLLLCLLSSGAAAMVDVTTCMTTIGPYGGSSDLTEATNLPMIGTSLTSKMTAASVKFCQQ